jgi:hypothetical protein
MHPKENQNYVDYFIATSSPKLKKMINIKEVLEEEYSERLKID